MGRPRIHPLPVVGQRFGRLVIVSPADKKYHWNVQCDCGNTTVTADYALRSRETHSCGCWKSEVLANSNRKHGMTGTPEFRAWCNMKRRCYDTRHNRYELYGGRGITVCELWANSFEAFYGDVGPRPSDEHTIDRIDVDGNYEPGNVRWATASEQMKNRRPFKHHQPITHCKNGHEFTPENTKLRPDGKGRWCRQCLRANVARYENRLRDHKTWGATDHG